MCGPWCRVSGSEVEDSGVVFRVLCLVSRVSDFEFRRNLRISAFNSGSRVSGLGSRTVRTEKELFTDNLLVLIHFIVEMIRWTGLTP